MHLMIEDAKFEGQNLSTDIRDRSSALFSYSFDVNKVKRLDNVLNNFGNLLMYIDRGNERCVPVGD